MSYSRLGDIQNSITNIFFTLLSSIYSYESDSIRNLKLQYQQFKEYQYGPALRPGSENQPISQEEAELNGEAYLAVLYQWEDEEAFEDAVRIKAAELRAMSQKNCRDKFLANEHALNESMALALSLNNRSQFIFGIEPEELKDIILTDRAIAQNPDLMTALGVEVVPMVRRYRLDEQFVQRVYNVVTQEKNTSTRQKAIETLQTYVDGDDYLPRSLWQRTNYKREYLKKLVDDYMKKRREDTREYKTTFFCLRFGYSQQVKLAAAQALRNILDNELISLQDWDELSAQHKAALKQGELGGILAEFNKVLKSEIEDTKNGYANEESEQKGVQRKRKFS